KFGGINHTFYEKVFELVLRLKGNYLWPVGGNAFNDDKANPQVAGDYGVVVETSHDERSPSNAVNGTPLFSDDNWGNVRRLPSLADTSRRGGFGLYYHFDYVGAPRSYTWINTNPISRVWEQLHLAYDYGVRTVWVVNVGDLKPMEFPISFFLDYAWHPDRIGA